MKTVFFTVLITLAGILAGGVSAQPISASRPGKITHVEGDVYLDGRRVQPAEYPSITENSLVRTEDGRAEILPASGITLRLGENSSFRMAANHPGDTRIEVLSGSVVVLTDEIARDTNPWDRRLAGKVTVVCEDTVTLANFGAYRFDNVQSPGAGVNFCRFKVYKGAATVQLASVSAVVMSGEMMALNRPCGDHVQINGFDIDELAQPLALARSIEINGVVHSEGPGEIRLEGLHIALESHDFLRRDTNSKRDGSFTLEKVFADRYTVSVYGLPEGYYVKSIRMGDLDALKQGLDLTRHAAGLLDILINPNGGQVEGSVTDAKQQPAAGATVALVPEAHGRERSYKFKKATTDQNGHFTFKGISPGNYKVFAWDRIEDAYQDAEFLYPVAELVKPYEKEGAVVVIREGSRESTQLKLIHYVIRMDARL